VAGVFVLLYGVGSGFLFRLMTSDTAVVEAGKAFLPWLLLMPLIGCPAFVWDGVYIGATASRDLRNSTVLCALGFFAAWFAGMGAAKLLGDFTPETAIHVLMAAYFVHLAVRALYLSVRYRKAVLNPTFSDISSR
jgi:MATE family multidrug resistance protein